ncbi:aspartate aminotransferase [[Emmonsia] crescens]|uniref:Aspartate aminotransferase n=1 Tax=[Emmonsia] crescens TaxID=73230 RepID=A0A0G2I2K3_9EURO|nr:aspartate aminotransferase [Emmonsia crescens UAMH 3008]
MAPVPQESQFGALEVPPYDEVFALMATFAADPSPQKVSLGAGVYRDNEAKSWRLNIVKKAEKLVCEDPTFDHEYLPIPGYQPFVDAARDLVFGPNSPVAKDRIASLQTISGTGANHLGARFLKEHLPRLVSPSSSSSASPVRKIWMSDPTWANHHLIWDLVAMSSTGSPIKTALYPYYHATTRSFDFDGMIRTLETSAQKGDIILLHACAHNPTGLDPTRAQWEAIASVCQRKGIFPFFDSAYQGFASGDLDNDAWAVREFVSRGMELCVAQSFSKNLGLYGQRVGAFHLLCHNEDAARRARSQLIELQRGEFSTPPSYGSRVASVILSDPANIAEWKQDLAIMSSRIKAMRHALYDELRRLGTPGNWEHIINQIGMFSYTGLTGEQIKTLRDDYHIYMLDSGRASISGLTTRNVKYVASAFDAVVRGKSFTSSSASNGH